MDDLPPAAIQITKLPTKGQIRVKEFGRERIVEVGDLIPKEIMSTIIYDQGSERCDLSH